LSTPVSFDVTARLRSIAFASCAVVMLAAMTPPPAPQYAAFSHPERVTILGYTGDEMEPFITRDGRYLLFNNRNFPPEKTDLYYAERIDARTFRFRGPLQGANSPELDAVASVDCGGTLYFISNRSYAATLSTIYRARFRNGIVSNVEIVPGVSRLRRGALNFDAEISSDGGTLYIVESVFHFGSGPKSASIAIFRKQGDGFVRDPDSDATMRAVNAGVLQYAPSISADGRELFFTRLIDGPSGTTPAIFRSERTDDRSPFGAPARVKGARGFVEAASLSPDGRILYYHAFEGGRFVIDLLTRPAALAGSGSACAHPRTRPARH